MDRPGICNGHECNSDCPALDCLHHISNPGRITYCPQCGDGYDDGGNCGCFKQEEKYPVCPECGTVFYYGGADYVREHGICERCKEGPIFKDGSFPDKDDIDEYWLLHGSHEW